MNCSNWDFVVVVYSKYILLYKTTISFSLHSYKRWIEHVQIIFMITCWKVDDCATFGENCWKSCTWHQTIPSSFLVIIHISGCLMSQWFLRVFCSYILWFYNFFRLKKCFKSFLFLLQYTVHLIRCTTQVTFQEKTLHCFIII